MADVPFIPFNSPFSSSKLQNGVNSVSSSLPEELRPPLRSPEQNGALQTLATKGDFQILLTNCAQGVGVDLANNNQIFNQVVEVMRFTPPNSESKTLWKEVQPIMKNTLMHVCKYDKISQDIVWELVNSMAIGGSVQTVLQINPQVARAKLAKALNESSVRLDALALELNTLDQTVMKSTEEALSKLIKSLGDKSVRSDDQLAETLKKMQECQEQVNHIMAERDHHLAEIERLNFLMKAAQTLQMGEKAALDAEKIRAQEIAELNHKSMKEMENIPRTVKETLTTEKKIWFFSLGTQSETVTRENPVFQREKVLVEDMIKARLNYMAQVEGKIKTSSDVQKVLAEEISNYKQALETEKKAIETFNKSGWKIVNTHIERIEDLRKEAEAIRQSYKIGNEETGLTGKALMECCAAVKGMSSAQHSSYSSCSALKGFLQTSRTFYGLILETALHPSTTDEMLYNSVNELIQSHAVMQQPINAMREDLVKYKKAMTDEKVLLLQ